MWKYKGREIFVQMHIQRTRQACITIGTAMIDDNNGGVDEIKQYRDARWVTPPEVRWIVPYNPYLLQYFNCYINVDTCESIKAVKYLFKCIYKGHDRTCITIGITIIDDNNEGVDKIKQYRDIRWVTPPKTL
jgi:hypothetical protein